MFEAILGYIGGLESVLALGGRILGLKKYFSAKKSNKENDSIPYRFILLFEKHGVHRNQIPRFFGHGLTPEDVSSPEKLLSKLTHDVLQAASDLFAIRLEWLECADNKIYPTDQYQFYQAPERFRQFLKDLQSNGEYHRLSAHFVISNHPTITTYKAQRDLEKKLEEEDEYNALLFIKERIGELGDTQISRYHLFSQQWTHQYWKARADLAAYAAIACATLGDAWGFQTAADISDFDRGERFMSDIDTLPNQQKISKNPKRKGSLWRPEDWVADPASFLDGVDEGKDAGLFRWLGYHKQGLMATNFSMYENVAEAFEVAFKNIQIDSFD